MEEPTTPREGQSTTGHFRESDVEYLRAQAREWLEAVLGEDLDEQTSLEDLLADGSLLYRVSHHIRDDSSFPGHRETSPRSVPVSPSLEKKNSSKYQPYASVEAFLKVCKEVGLQDLDVFNPSDAVDKKDIRHVCVCLRRLSKKGRSLGIQVPDFDNVKDTLVTPSKMPRDAVRRTQESLQKSSSRSSRSGSANGLVSSETSSSIADLRKDDAESETYNKVHHDLDVAAERREPIATDSHYTAKVAEPGVETLPLHNEGDAPTKTAKPLVSIRSGVDSTHGPAPKAAELDEKAATAPPADSKDAQESHTASEPVPEQPPVKEKPQIKPFQGLVVDKPKAKPVEAPVDEKPEVKPAEQRRKGLFIAHLLGKEPYAKEEGKKDESDGGSPWLLPLVGGAVAIAGVVAGLLFWKQRSGEGDSAGNFYSGGSYNVRSGDNLTKIAKEYGKEHWREIAEKNPSIGNPDLIYPGDRLNL